MSTRSDVKAFELPKYLDIYEAANVPTNAQGKHKEWGFFTDGEGRVIAQLVDLVMNQQQAENESTGDLTCNQLAENAAAANPKAVVLIIGTDREENFHLPSSEVPEKMFSSDPDPSYRTSETWVEKQEKYGQKVASQPNWKYSDSNETSDAKLSDPGPSKLVNKLNNLKGYPCVKSEWYIRKPTHVGTLVDGVTIVDTKVLAEDVRGFLKSNFISLSKFAKDHLKRRQGTLSDLLNHPKSWAELSSKGRDNYIKLMEFLSSEELPLLVSQLCRKRTRFCSEILPLSDLKSSAALNIISMESINHHCEENITIKQDNRKAFSKSVPYGNVDKSLSQNVCPHSGGCGRLFDEASCILNNKHHTRMWQKKVVATVDIMTSEEPVNKRLAAVDNKFDPETDEHDSAADATSRKYVCGSCWKGFKSRQHLTKHLSHAHCVGGRHLRDGFTCYVCRKVLKNISALEVHMRSHTNYRPFKCDQCKLGFKTKANLQRHMRIHTGERPYACMHCPSKFTEATALITHTRTHTGERPLKCKFCDRRFAQYTPLKQHMLIHENKKPHLCEKCGKSFRQKTNLKVHVERHRGAKKFNCTTCNMAFITKSDFNRHSIKHTKEKPYQCMLCLKSFTRRLDLHEHLKALEGSTTSECEVCSKKFCDEDELNKHAKTHMAPFDINENLDPKFLTKNKVVNPPLTEAFATLDDGNNILLLKINANNEKRYYIPPVQTFESTSECLSDDAAINNYQPLVLAPAEHDPRIQFTATSENSDFLRSSIDLAGQQVSVVGANPELLFGADSNMLTSIQRVTLPIPLTSHGEAAIKEGSDPNMQCAVAKTPDDSVISMQNNLHIPGLPEKRLKVDPCQIVVQNSQDAEGNMIITIPGQSQLASPDGELDLGSHGNICDAGLMDTHTPISMAESADINSDGATYIIVNTE